MYMSIMKRSSETHSEARKLGCSSGTPLSNSTAGWPELGPSSPAKRRGSRGGKAPASLSTSSWTCSCRGVPPTAYSLPSISVCHRLQFFTILLKGNVFWCGSSAATTVPAMLRLRRPRGPVPTSAVSACERGELSAWVAARVSSTVTGTSSLSTPSAAATASTIIGGTCWPALSGVTVSSETSETSPSARIAACLFAVGPPVGCVGGCSERPRAAGLPRAPRLRTVCSMENFKSSASLSSSTPSNCTSKP
mmetsp:Transcript_75782/g.209128  ORF Transcript_75782/g.209128 Transcript_75782/m.209128 type:complete len:250 (+) Transcript_75782:2699-3448(+)